ncbi:MAG: acyl carrier protein [Prevotella sp.]|nr:acyl carrier protein [Prevotella sp.]
MEINEFIEKFAENIEVENIDALTPETQFRDLDEWSSLSVMLTIAFFDDEFDKQVSNIDIKEAQTIQDLYNLVAE